MIMWYPLEPTNDMLYIIAQQKRLDEEEKWSMQTQSKPIFDEYLFVVEGNGKIYVGDEIYDVEPRDLVIVPRGVTHKVVGDITVLAFIAKHNVYGQTLGEMIPFIAHDMPYRDSPEEMPKIGEYIEVDTAHPHPGPKK